MAMKRTDLSAFSIFLSLTAVQMNWWFEINARSCAFLMLFLVHWHRRLFNRMEVYSCLCVASQRRSMVQVATSCLRFIGWKEKKGKSNDASLYNSAHGWHSTEFLGSRHDKSRANFDLKMWNSLIQWNQFDGKISYWKHCWGEIWGLGENSTTQPSRSKMNEWMNVKTKKRKFLCASEFMKLHCICRACSLQHALCDLRKKRINLFSYRKKNDSRCLFCELFAVFLFLFCFLLQTIFTQNTI